MRKRVPIPQILVAEHNASDRRTASIDERVTEEISLGERKARAIGRGGCAIGATIGAIT